MSNERIHGLHRAIVVESNDPQGLNRVRVSVPSLGLAEQWAMPCRSPGSHELPAQGATVWLAFEAGDPRLPVWVGVLK